MSNNIYLKKIDESNFIECFNLELGVGQEKLVSHPIRSLAQAYVYYKQCTPFGVFHDDTMVGYVMVIYDYDEETYNIWHLMIDKNHQGKKYGEKAVQLCLEYIRNKPFGTSDEVLLTCNEYNKNALHIYQKLGFYPTGNKDDDEIEMKILV